MRQTLLLIGILHIVVAPALAQPTAVNQGLVTYFPLDGNAEDMSGQNNTGILKGAESVDGRFGEAYRFGDGGGLYTAQVRDAPNVYTVTMWFKARTGGQLIGFESEQESRSFSHDRHLYLGDDGRLYWAMYGGRGGIVSTPRSYTDDQWHHVAAVLSDGGAHLYVDGKLAAHDSEITQGASYRGYWRLATGTFSGWVRNRPADSDLQGALDEVRIYGRALGEAEVRSLYAYDPTAAAMTPQEMVEQMVEANIRQWSQRGKFEKVEDYEARVNDETRSAVRDSLRVQALAEVGEERIDWGTARNTYDPDAEVFTVRVEHLEPFELTVPIAEAEAFDANFRGAQYLNPIYGLSEGDDLVVKYVEVTDPASGRTYVYERP